jgi:muramoyltetrapeptide carboxypeptidase
MGKIGIIALSSPCRRDIYEDALRYLHEQGLGTRVALDPIREYGKDNHLFSSDSAQNRAGALHELFADPEIELILSARGAYGSMEILPYLDFDLLAKNRKPLIGFSDTTAILLALAEKAQCPCYHGPSLSSLSSLVNEGKGRADFSRTMDLLRGASRKLFGDMKLERSGTAGEILGGLTGGNLTLIAALSGTPWQPDLGGKILFFEEVGVKPYAIHRLLLQMKISGQLSDISGVIVGSLSGCEHPRGLGPSTRRVILEVFEDQKTPIFWGAPFGHDAPNHPVPLGVMARITSDNRLELC